MIYVGIDIAKKRHVAAAVDSDGTAMNLFPSQTTTKALSSLKKVEDYRIGKVYKKFIPDKTVDEEFHLLTIAGICDECRNCDFYEGNIYLEVGCPTEMLTAQRGSTKVISYEKSIVREKD